MLFSSYFFSTAACILFSFTKACYPSSESLKLGLWEDSPNSPTSKPSRFQKDPIIWPAGVPSDLSYPQAPDFLANSSGANGSHVVPEMVGATRGGAVLLLTQNRNRHF